MKTIFLFCTLSVLSITVNAQRKADIGFFAGTDYYMGDINPSKLFYSPGYAFGPLFRININDRYSIRFSTIYAHIEGSDSDFDYIITKRNFPVTFSASMLNLASQVEYNFFPYKTGESKQGFSPYIFTGIGYSVLLSSDIRPTSPKAESHMIMPFGVGVKMNFTRRLSAGAEWSYIKTFSDRIDGVVSPVSENKLYNNDWYSFAGLFITYKFFKFAVDCPVYD